MYTFITIIIALVCLALVLVVLVQNPKGGGLGAGFGGGASSSMGGAQNAADFLEKATWFLAIAMLALSLVSVVFISSDVNTIDTPDDVEIQFPVN